VTVRPGLLSVTLRHLHPDRVVAIAADAGLAAVEWGGDVHVPHGDLAAASLVAGLTSRAGLEISAYGSYYRLGHSADSTDSPAPAASAAEAVVATAARLGAPVIRVWAGRQGSASSDVSYRARVRDDALRLAERADPIGIVLEYHRETLTDTRSSTAALLDELRSAGVRCLWQPQPERSIEENAGDLRALLPDLANLHVFAWNPDRSRLPLAAHRDRWARWLAVAAEAPGDRYASLEFVPGDDPAQVQTDAATLHTLLNPA
jgi:sugar phosphate isomerase/epimerase